MKNNVWSIKSDGKEMVVIAGNIVEALLAVVPVTQIKEVTSARLVYTEEEMKSK